jgi:Dolichyl-phosphate-mannose-protein mannosyltransferase
MAHRRSLVAIVLLAAILHAVGIARTLLPAQDGLKLLRFARQFQSDPWPDVVRGADVHPLYSALVAMVEPPVSWMIGESPDAWRLAAQLVAVVASLGVLVPVYFLTKSLFDRRVAFIAAGVLALLPRVAEAGQETLPDSLGLFATFMALWLAARALSHKNWLAALGSGLIAGLGYLARPEVILVPVVIALAWLIDRLRLRSGSRRGQLVTVSLMLILPGLMVAGYAAVKGEISEKPSLRWGAGLGPQAILKRPVPQQVPRGLDDPHWDFSPKEESDHVAIRGVQQAFTSILNRWWDELVWFFAVMTVWGWARRKNIRELIQPSPERERAGSSAQAAPPLPDGRSSESPGVEGLILGLFAVVYTLALLRHCTALGYLSWRHVLPLVVASMPWAAGGTYICCHRIGEFLRLGPRGARLGRLGAMALCLVLSVTTQLNPHHLHHFSRWGHWAAGRWLQAHATPGEEVLDTRGWARFVSGLPGYDYWHVRQALTDSRLSYVLVGLDELTASSARGATLRALLSYAATPLQDFPASPTDPTPAVRIYRFRRPASWEGIAR